MKIPSIIIISYFIITEVCLGNTILVPSQELTIQAGINAAVNGDTVLVADGTYTGDGNRDIDFGGKAIVVLSERGYNYTWIDVEGAHRGFIFQNGEDSTSILEGFTITGVNSGATCPGEPCVDPNLHYSGVLCVSSSPTILNCQFADNISTQAAGMALFSSSAVVDSCRFIRNSSRDAGAMFIHQAADCKIRDCLFLENGATASDSSGGGGALWVNLCSGLTIENCQFIDNSSTGASGVIRAISSRVDVTGCMFEGNSSQVGAIACIIPIGRSEGTWSNCTMYDNNAPPGRGVFHVHEGSREIYFENCVMAEGSGGAVQVDGIPGGLFFSCCNLYGNSGGDWTTPIIIQSGINGNTSEDPLFMNADSSDFRLQYCSPCNSFNNECEILIGAYEIAQEETDQPYFSCHTDTLEIYLPPDTSGECHVPLADYNVADCQPITFLPETAWWGEYGGIYWTADTGGLYQFTVMASKPPYGGDTCDVFVYVKGPSIECPEYTFTPHPDSNGLINIPLTIHNVFYEHVTIIPDIAHWLEISNVGFLQFTADTAGTYTFQIVAETRFGKDSCEVIVSVGGPIIDCSEDTVCAEVKVSGEACIDLQITSGSLGEINSGDALWSNDQLCFYPDDTGGVYVFSVVVNDAFGKDSCDVAVSVLPKLISNIIPIEAITCPGEEVCVQYSIDFVTPDKILILSPYATYSNDSICVIPNDTGLMTFQIYAGTANCYDTATVTLFVNCPDTVNVTPDGTIQAALDASSNGDIILLEDGVYTGEGNREIDFKGKQVTLRSKNGPINCIIDCETDTISYLIANRGMWFRNGEDEQTIVDGITFYRCYGYAIRCDSSSPTIQNCIFNRNGCGVYLKNSSHSRVENSTFYRNKAFDARGAATYISESSPTFENCKFIENYSWGGAAAIEYSPAEPVFNNCLFIRNGQWPETGYPMGAAIFLYNGVHATMGNCTFFGNRGTGSVLWINGDNPSHADFDNCILAFNRDDIDGYYAGGPINCNDIIGCSINLNCCNVYGNRAGDYIDCITDQANINGNISADPLFVDTLMRDLHLLQGSPCLPENNSCVVQMGSLGVGSFNTLAGYDVEVINDNVTIIFDTVNILGQTEVSIDSTGPIMPGDITTVPTDPERYHNIHTTAVYQGIISICMSYDDSEITTEENNMSMQHWVDSNWVDITISHDTVNNIICGETESLSPFVITQPKSPTSVENQIDNLPNKFSLYQNYPNPFNPSTLIEFDLPTRSVVKIIVYNLLGQEIVKLVDQEFDAGNHKLTWDGSTSNNVRVSSGVYFYRFQAGDHIETKKMLLLK